MIEEYGDDLLMPKIKYKDQQRCMNLDDFIPPYDEEDDEECPTTKPTKE